MALANVALTDTWDTWRIRLNQVIVNLDQANTLIWGVTANAIGGMVAANIAYGASNNVSSGANSFASYVGVSANLYSDVRVGSANGWANYVGASANSKAVAIGTAGNNFTIFVGNSANAYTDLAVLNATSGTTQLDYSNTIGTRSNSWASLVGTAGNNYSVAIGTAGNNRTLTVIGYSNNYAAAVGTAVNSTISVADTAGNNYAVILTTAGNNYTNYVGASANSRAAAIGTAANNYAAATYGTVGGITAAFNKANSALPNGAATIAGALTSTGAISDSLGNVRDVPVLTKSSNYQLQAADAGKCISISSGDITVASGVHATNDVITIFRNAGTSGSIIASGVTIYLAGTSLTGTRTIAQRGLATLLCVSTDVFVISGSGLT